MGVELILERSVKLNRKVSNVEMAMTVIDHTSVEWIFVIQVRDEESILTELIMLAVLTE